MVENGKQVDYALPCLWEMCKVSSEVLDLLDEDSFWQVQISTFLSEFADDLAIVTASVGIFRRLLSRP